MSQTEKDKRITKSLHILAKQAKKQAERNDVTDVDLVGNQIIVSYAQGNRKTIPMSSIALDSAPANIIQKELIKDGKDNTKEFLENLKLFAELNVAIKNGLGINAQVAQPVNPFPIPSSNTVDHQARFNADSAINKDADIIVQEGKKGEDGKDGRGVKSTKIKDGDLIVKYTDGTEENAGSLKNLIEKIVDKIPGKNTVQLIGGGYSGGGGSTGGGGTTPAPSITIELKGDVTGIATQEGSKVTIDTTTAEPDYSNITITTDQITDFDDEYHRKAVLYPLSLFKPPVESMNWGYQDLDNVHHLTALNIWGDRVRGGFSSSSDNNYIPTESGRLTPGISSPFYSNGGFGGFDENNFISYQKDPANGPVLCNMAGRTVKLKVSAFLQMSPIAGNNTELQLFGGTGYFGETFNILNSTGIILSIPPAPAPDPIYYEFLVQLAPLECVTLMFIYTGQALQSQGAFRVDALNLIAEQ